MKVGVFNAHWTTLGGGEKFGAGIAEVLNAGNDVELLATEPFDLVVLAERLHVDLSGITVRVIPEEPSAVAEASADYELFVNVSYMSHDRSRAPRSLYVVHFPTPPDDDLSSLQRTVVRIFRPLMRHSQGVPSAWGTGFQPREGGRLTSRFWTTGAGEFFVEVDRPSELVVVIRPTWPAVLGPRTVRVEVEDGATVERTLAPASRWHRSPRVRVPVSPRADGRPARVIVRSDTFVPEEVIPGSKDRRHLGMPVAGLRIGSGLAAWLGQTFPVLYRTPGSGDFLASYTRVLSNSGYTQAYVKEYWGVDSGILYPPVTMHAARPKEPIILSVGRFFRSEGGHSKKQIEMARAFRSLCEQGLEGWTLHFVGGCAPSERPYLDAVLAEAAGLPVEVHVDAPGGVLADLYGRASIFWSATGLGEDPQKQPGLFEHFGITTVEAMSAGAVPVVHGAAGQLEIVRDGVTGLHFATIDELVAKTRRVVDDPALRSRLSTAAAERARAFSMDAFGDNLNREVAATLSPR